MKSTIDLSNEEYQVLIKPQDTPYITRITYSKRSGGKIIEIEELDLEEKPLYSCKFYGRTSEGNGCSWLKGLKAFYSQLKTKDYVQATEIYYDEYFKKH